jgi:hypothetical protein
MKWGKALVVALAIFAGFVSTCEMYGGYGKLGGADKTVSAEIEEVLAPKVGVWYSHYGGKRLDGYTIGRWKNLKEDLGEKLKLFSGFEPDRDPEKEPLFHDKYIPLEDDYYVFYDSTVYGQGDDGSGEGTAHWNYGYMGIVRAVNTFHDTKDTGAIIIEYFNGCYPQWSEAVVTTPLPFFGVYFRVLDSDSIQMANAVVLENVFAGLPYYTETATLEEAIAKNNADNDGEFISWGVVIPQDREVASSR